MSKKLCEICDIFKKRFNPGMDKTEEVSKTPIPKDIITLYAGRNNDDIDIGDYFVLCEPDGTIVSTRILRYLGMWYDGTHAYNGLGDKGWSEPYELCVDTSYIKKLKPDNLGNIYVNTRNGRVCMAKKVLITEKHDYIAIESYSLFGGNIYSVVITEEDIHPTAWQRYSTEEV